MYALYLKASSLNRSHCTIHCLSRWRNRMIPGVVLLASNKPFLSTTAHQFPIIDFPVTIPLFLILRILRHTPLSLVIPDNTALSCIAIVEASLLNSTPFGSRLLGPLLTLLLYRDLARSTHLLFWDLHPWLHFHLPRPQLTWGWYTPLFKGLNSFPQYNLPRLYWTCFHRTAI